MKVTNGKDFVNSFVVGVALGAWQMSHVCLGDRQLYPEDTSGMSRLAVELPKKGTLEWAYWVHAVAAIEDLVTPSRYMELRVGGSRFVLRSSFNEVPTVLFENGVFLFYPDEGASLHSVQPGDYVEVRAVIPQIDDVPLSVPGEDKSGSKGYALPFLPNSGLYLAWTKGVRKRSAYVRYTLSGLGSGAVHVAGQGQINGHGRGNRVDGVAWPWPCRVVNADNGAGFNDYVRGDSGMRLDLTGGNACQDMVGRPRYPAFTMNFRLKVVSIA